MGYIYNSGGGGGGLPSPGRAMRIGTPPPPATFNPLQGALQNLAPIHQQMLMLQLQAAQQVRSNAVRPLMCM